VIEAKDLCVTMVEVATGWAVRVTPKAEAMLANQQTSFFKDYRKKGMPASRVPLEVLQPLVDRVMGTPAEQLPNVGLVFDRPVERHRHSFDGLCCEACGEMVVKGYARLAGERRVCIPCYEQLTGLREPRASV
jgi:formylmethanofuran dehydrogenase subunit E